MHSVSVEKLPNEPIVLSTFTEEWNMSRDVGEYAQEVLGVFDALDEDCHHILNLLAVKFNLAEVILGANTASRGAAAFMHHQRCPSTVVVTTDMVTALAARGLKHPTFGSVPMTVFETMEEAMMWVRTQISLQK